MCKLTLGAGGGGATPASSSVDLRGTKYSRRYIVSLLMDAGRSQAHRDGPRTLHMHQHGTQGNTSTPLCMCL
jgi:hypothetical protein